MCQVSCHRCILESLQGRRNWCTAVWVLPRRCRKNLAHLATFQWFISLSVDHEFPMKIAIKHHEMPWCGSVMIILLRDSQMIENSWATSLCRICPYTGIAILAQIWTLIKRIHVETDWWLRISYSGPTWLLQRLNDFTKHIKAPRTANILTSSKIHRLESEPDATSLLVLEELVQAPWCGNSDALESCDMLWLVVTCGDVNQDTRTMAVVCMAFRCRRCYLFNLSSCSLYWKHPLHLHPLVSSCLHILNRTQQPSPWIILICLYTQFRMRPPYPSTCIQSNAPMLRSYALPTEAPGGGSLGSRSAGISVSVAEGASVGLGDLGPPVSTHWGHPWTAMDP